MKISLRFSLPSGKETSVCSKVIIPKLQVELGGIWKTRFRHEKLAISETVQDKNIVSIDY